MLAHSVEAKCTEVEIFHTDVICFNFCNFSNKLNVQDSCFLNLDWFTQPFCVGREFSATTHCGGITCYCITPFNNGLWKLPGILKWKKKNYNRGESSAKIFQQRHFHSKASSFWCPVRAMQNWSSVLSAPCILSDRVILRNLLSNKSLGYVEVKCRGKGWVLATSHRATQESWMGTRHRSSVWILSSEASFGVWVFMAWLAAGSPKSGWVPVGPLLGVCRRRRIQPRSRTLTAPDV